MVRNQDIAQNRSELENLANKYETWDKTYEDQLRVTFENFQKERTEVQDRLDLLKQALINNYL